MKKFFSKRLIIAVLGVAMALTTAVSLVWWASGIQGASNNTGEFTVQIGTGQGVTTQLNLAGPTSDLAGRNLVPVGKAAVSLGGASDNVESVTFTIPVTWNYLAGDAATFGNTIASVLTVTHASTTVDGVDATDSNDFRATGGTAPIFTVEIVSVQTGTDAAITGTTITNGKTFNIVGATTYSLTIRVTMGVPLNEATYGRVAGKDVIFGFNMSVADPS
jgi:hypothetical protein